MSMHPKPNARAHAPPRVKHAFVLCLRRDDMLLLVLEEACYTLESHVVGLRGTTGEDDFLGVSTNK